MNQTSSNLQLKESTSSPGYFSSGKMVLVLLVTSAAFAFGVAVNWRWLAGEASRMPWWMFPLSFVPEAVAFYWFLAYMAQPKFTQGQAPSLGERRIGFGFVLTFGLSDAVSVGMSLLHYQDETTGMARAIRTIATIDQFTVKHGRGVVYTLHVSFNDARGNLEHADFFLEQDDLPQPQLTLSQAGTPPPRLAIIYDPDFPRRAWIVDSGRDPNENRLYFMNFVTLLYTGFMLLLVGWRTNRRHLLEGRLHLTPFLSLTVALLVSGAFKFAVGEY